MNRIFLALVLITSTFLTSNAVNAENKYPTPYDKYIIKSVGDFLRICGPLDTPGANKPEDFYNALSCLSFMSGILTGYSSTISIGAEASLAKLGGISRAEIISKMDSDKAIHDQLDKQSISSHFLCFSTKAGLFDIARGVTRAIKSKGISQERSAHYIILNEIEKIHTCVR